MAGFFRDGGVAMEMNLAVGKCFAMDRCGGLRRILAMRTWGILAGPGDDFRSQP